MAVDMGPILIGIIIFPIIFGILGFVLSKEKRFIRAISWFGISFAVVLVLNIVGGQLKRVEYPQNQSQNYEGPMKVAAASRMRTAGVGRLSRAAPDIHVRPAFFQ